MEAVRQWEEAERQRAIDEAWAQMKQEQQEELQVRAWAIMVTQGTRTPGPSMAVAGPTARACEWCVGLLWDPEGCMVSEKGKVWACMPCQKAHKTCNWPLGLVEVTAAMGSRTEGSGRPAPKCMVKRRMRGVTNALP